MKIGELDGALLDLWVARAEGKCSTVKPGVWGRALVNELGRCSITANTWECARYFEPSKNWTHGGPIVERHTIGFGIPISEHGYQAFLYKEGVAIISYGKTHLVAAMRAYVRSKFGDELPDVGLVESRVDSIAHEEKQA